MNYKHIYHAGNFADVAKHVALLYCLQALCRKESPFFVLDTHAGRGYYDLQAAEAAKSGEAERGIQTLIAAAAGAAPLLDYMSAIRARHGKRLARYPGSPALIAQCLRPQDRALFVELMPAEARTIDREIESQGRFSTEIDDGYAVLKASIAAAGKKVADAEVRYGIVPFPNKSLEAAMLETAGRVGLPAECMPEGYMHDA